MATRSLFQQPVSEIARVFRINPILLGEMGRATWSNSSEQGKQFVQYTLAPWVCRWQSEIALKLLTPEEVRSFRVELDTDGFTSPDFSARATAYSQMIAARVINPNEARDMESLPPYVGGEQFLNPNIENVQETARVG